MIISKLGRFAGLIGSRAVAPRSSSPRVLPEASITAEALRHLGLAEDSSEAIKVSSDRSQRQFRSGTTVGKQAWSDAFLVSAVGLMWQTGVGEVEVALGDGHWVRPRIIS